MSSGIIRARKDKGCFVASNEPFNDETLSWEARGVMGYLLSKPDDWITHTYDLINRGPAGEYKMRRIIKELESAGYIRRSLPTVNSASFTRLGDNGDFELNEIYLSNGDVIDPEAAPPWIYDAACDQVTEYIAKDQSPD